MRVEKKDKWKLFALFIGFVILAVLFMEGRELDKDTPEGKKVKAAGKEEGKEAQEFSKPDVIRVLIKNQNYEGIFHDEVNVCSDKLMYVKQGEKVKEIPTGQAFSLGDAAAEENQEFTEEDPIQLEGGRLTVTTLTRSQGEPTYTGKLEIRKGEQGYVLINEVDFETYLKGVLPSEMPAKYEKEALKAQAVCARTYAYMKYRGTPAYPEYEAHLDDSVQFQVYQNQVEAESASQAVDETSGQILTYNNNIAATYYFSTSWGWTTGMDAWLKESVPYLSSVSVGENLPENCEFESMLASPSGIYYEAEEPWYRWNISIDVAGGFSELLQNIITCQQENPEEVKVCSIEEDTFAKGQILPSNCFRNVEVTRRGSGGVACAIVFTSDSQKVQVEGQHNIRKILALSSNQIVRQDGSKLEHFGLLPSGFFTLQCSQGEDGSVSALELAGGGFGHGVGLSQNGANRLAMLGKNYQEILSFFYTDVEITALK